MMTYHERGVTEKNYDVECRQIQFDCTKIFFTNNVVREWNSHPPSIVQCTTINSFNSNSTTISSNKVSDKDFLIRCRVIGGLFTF